MQSVKNIEYVIIEDIYSEYDEDERKHRIPEGIILGVSNDDSVHYDWSEGIIQREKDNMLLLNDYHGKLLIPKHCGIQIADSIRPISGLINSPAYIDSLNDINIMIGKESGLELIAKTLYQLKLNGKMIPKILKDKSKSIPSMIGKDFSVYEDRFLRKKSNGAPKIIEEAHGHIADFGNTDNYCPIQVCMKYNLAVIGVEASGDTNIYYENFDPEIILPEFEIRKDIRRLEKDIVIAKRNEEFEKVIELRAELQGLKFLKAQMVQNAAVYDNNIKITYKSRENKDI